jgi:sulfite dehydrogenase (cytochrome) subunit B
MKRILIVLIILVVAAGVAYAQEKQLTLPIVKVELAAGPGQNTTSTLCNICHSVDYIIMQPKSSRTTWAGSVNKMKKVFGAPISDSDADVIINYLATNYGNGK